MIVAIIWLAMASLALILYLLFPPEIYYWNKVYGECKKKDAKHQYIIRFIFKDVKKDYDLKTTTIYMEMTDGQITLATAKITPKMISESILQPDGFRVCRFLFFQRDPLTEMTYVVLYHDGVGSIRVRSVEIQDIKSPNANIAYVGKDIVKMDPEKAWSIQSNPAATQEPRIIEQELRPSLTLSGLEYLLFFFVAFNLMLLMTIYVIPCKNKGFCANYTGGELSSIFSGVVASIMATIVFVGECVIQRYLIKKSMAQGKQYCKGVNYGCLISLLVIGAFTGIFAALTAAENRKFPDTNVDNVYHHEIYWMFAVGFGLVIFFMIWISSLAVIAYLFGFFTEPIDAEPALKGGIKSPRGKTLTTRSSDDYLTATMTKGIKVKSISQYKQVKPSSTVSSEVKSKSVRKADEDDDTGDKYYQQLMAAQGKVKSISKYQGTK